MRYETEDEVVDETVKVEYYHPVSEIILRTSWQVMCRCHASLEEGKLGKLICLRKK